MSMDARTIRSSPWSGSAYQLQVEITSDCNLKCTMCPLTLGATFSGVAAEHMKEATWAQVVAAAVDIGSANLTGFGENTSNPRFLAMIRELDDLGVRTCFSTNGIRVTPEIVAGLAELRHLERVNVSIDSPDPAIYREIRGGKVEKALAGLARLAEGLPKRAALTVSSVVMESNLASLLEFPAILGKLQVASYSLQSLHDRTQTLAEDDLRRDRENAEILAEIRRRCEERGVVFELCDQNRIALEAADPEEARKRYYEAGGPFSPDRTRQCAAPWRYPFIDRLGRVYPCCHGDEDSTMGNLNHQPFDVIWTGAKFESFRNALADGIDVPAMCRKCNNIKLGPHPARFAGEIDLGLSRLSGRRGLRVVVRNVGEASWTGAVPLTLGVVNDRDSVLALPTWRTPGRVATMNEAEVPPGEYATIDFDLGRGPSGTFDYFGLLFEGVCWLDPIVLELPDVASRTFAPWIATRAKVKKILRLDRPHSPLRPLVNAARRVLKAAGRG